MNDNKYWERMRWQYTGSLFLPALVNPTTVKRSINETLRQTFATAVSHEEVFGHRIDHEKLVELVGSRSQLFWVPLLAKIMAVISSRGKYKPEPQVQLAKNLFNKSTLQKIDAASSGGAKNLVFNEWQLVSLIKLSLLVSKFEDDCSPPKADTANLLEQCLLGMNDYIPQREFTEPYHSSHKEKVEALLESMLRTCCFQQGENPKHVMARYFDIYFNIASNPHAKGISSYIEFGPLFYDCFGISIELFFALSLGIYSKCLASGLPEANLSNQEFLIDRRSFFSKTKIKQPEGQRLFDRLSISADRFKAEHSKVYHDSFGQLYDFTVFRQSPLVSLGEHKLAPINPEWVYELLGEGIFWLISDALQGKNQKLFRTFFGELYQIYIEQLFERLYPTSGIQRRLYCDIPYEGNRSSDAIVYYPRTLVLFEAKWPTLRMQQTMIPGNLEAFDKDVENIIIHAASQLDRNIKDFRSGKLHLDGINSDDVEFFYPVIVTARPFPIVPPLTEYILKEVNNKGLLKDFPHIKRLEIISAEELELLEALISNGATFPEVLERKWASNLRDNNLKWHIYQHECKGKLPENLYLDKVFNQVYKMGTLLLFGVED